MMSLSGLLQYITISFSWKIHVNHLMYIDSAGISRHRWVPYHHWVSYHTVQLIQESIYQHHANGWFLNLLTSCSDACSLQVPTQNTTTPTLLMGCLDEVLVHLLFSPLASASRSWPSQRPRHAARRPGRSIEDSGRPAGSRSSEKQTLGGLQVIRCQLPVKAIYTSTRLYRSPT